MKDCYGNGYGARVRICILKGTRPRICRGLPFACERYGIIMHNCPMKSNFGQNRCKYMSKIMNSWLTARAKRVVACTLLFWDHMPYTRRARIPSPNDQKRAINRRPVVAAHFLLRQRQLCPSLSRRLEPFSTAIFDHFEVQDTPPAP